VLFSFFGLSLVASMASMASPPVNNCVAYGVTDGMGNYFVVCAGTCESALTCKNYTASFGMQGSYFGCACQDDLGIPKKNRRGCVGGITLTPLAGWSVSCEVIQCSDPCVPNSLPEGISPTWLCKCP
jgi:hypothetical protein